MDMKSHLILLQCWSWLNPCQCHLQTNTATALATNVNVVLMFPFTSCTSTMKFALYIILFHSNSNGLLSSHPLLPSLLFSQNLTYITSPPGFDVVVSIGHKVVLNKTVSLQDPDVCFDIPVPVLDAKACLDFTNISLTKTNVSACIAIDFSVLHKDLGTVSLGCFGINFDLGVESRFKVIKKLLDQQKELLAHKYDSILKQIPITDDEPSNKISNKMVDPNVSSGDFCECSGEQCDCCAHVSIHKLKINDSVCVNITLLESELALNILLIVDNKVVMNKTLSLSSLSKLCVPLPWVPDSKVCIDFNNINITKDEVSACVGFEAYLFHIRLFSIDLGCFHFHIGDQHRQLPIALMLKKLGEEIQRVKELN
eukprot:TRINITY_DN600_c0_g1_i2.p1 TRINITY_DN600_c0_g1~~TRINITY_DN600_c0_g1_i2.p1  ORF type:complete len:369 (+),score=110.30 TRINITY_DN600_c0_g1_i2:433-1539(+)